MDELVCPDCGSEEFTQRRYVSAEYTVRVMQYGIQDVSEEILDSGERDADDITCAECGATYDAGGSELVTVDTYNKLEDDNA